MLHICTGQYLAVVLNKSSDVRDLLQWVWHPLTLRDPSSITQVKQGDVGQFNHPFLLSIGGRQSFSAVKESSNFQQIAELFVKYCCLFFLLWLNLLQNTLVSIKVWQDGTFSYFQPSLSFFSPLVNMFFQIFVNTWGNTYSYIFCENIRKIFQTCVNALLLNFPMTERDFASTSDWSCTW